MLLILEETESAAYHDGNLAEVGIWKDALVCCLTTILIIRTRCCYLDIDSQRRGIGQITEPGIIRKHWQDGAIVFEDSWLSQLRIEKLDLDLILIADRGTEGCCGCGCGCRRGCVLDNLTHEGIGSGSRKAGGRCEN